MGSQNRFAIQNWFAIQWQVFEMILIVWWLPYECWFHGIAIDSQSTLQFTFNLSVFASVSPANRYLLNLVVHWIAPFSMSFKIFQIDCGFTIKNTFFSIELLLLSTPVGAAAAVDFNDTVILYLLSKFLYFWSSNYPFNPYTHSFMAFYWIRFVLITANAMQPVSLCAETSPACLPSLPFRSVPSRCFSKKCLW